MQKSTESATTAIAAWGTLVIIGDADGTISRWETTTGRVHSIATTQVHECCEILLVTAHNGTQDDTLLKMMVSMARQPQLASGAHLFIPIRVKRYLGVPSASGEGCC